MYVAEAGEAGRIYFCQGWAQYDAESTAEPTAEFPGELPSESPALCMQLQLDQSPRKGVHALFACKECGSSSEALLWIADGSGMLMAVGLTSGRIRGTWPWPCNSDDKFL